MSQVVRAMGVVQIDSVNVLVRSQELPLFARLGTHDRQAIPKATASGRLFEYWAHAAAHVPTEHHRLWRWKMESKHDGPWEVARDLLRRRRGYIDEVLAQVASDGPVAAGDLSQRTEKKNPWWDWDDAKVALEYLFYCGRVTATRRSSDFARLYDLPERVIPADHLAAPTPNVEDAHRELVHLATKSLGVGTLKDVTDYYRLKQDQVKPRLAELVESGQIVPVSVADRRGTFYMDASASIPRRLEARALLSMFDPIVWHRDRGRWLFDFDYAIEIYTPAAKRRYGYYVLPFLLGDRLVARVDLKADRAESTLLAGGVFSEAGVEPARVVDELTDELRLMADWLELDRVKIGTRGDLATRLRRSFTPPRR
ncbi:MAG: winged helix-turn-helix domain-containing protein [Ilumatobacteraceae bacterium]